MEKLIQEVYSKYWKKLKKKPNVIGIDGKLRPKIRKGKIYRKIKCIRIYVSSKVPLEEFDFAPSYWESFKRIFRRNSHFHKRDLVPSFIEGVPTDLVEIGPIEALSNKDRLRPLKAGISSMHYKGTACTTNGFFREDQTGKICVASNNHCYAEENKAKIGDPIVQPSPYDGGNLDKDQIGNLYKFIPIHFNGFVCPFRRTLHKFMFWEKIRENKVDIAFAEVKVDWLPEATYIGSFKGKRLPKEGEKVQKTGRTTEYTVGKVLSLDWTGSVSYSRGMATFTDCILIEGRGFSKGGDSGSPVFDMNGNYIGALFAGSSSHTIICKYSNIELESEMTLIIKK